MYLLKSMSINLIIISLWSWPSPKPGIRFNAEFILKKVILRPRHYNYYVDTFTSILSFHIRNSSKSKFIYTCFLLWYSIFLYWVLKLKPNHIYCFISDQRNLMWHNICPLLFSYKGVNWDWKILGYYVKYRFLVKCKDNNIN